MQHESLIFIWKATLKINALSLHSPIIKPQPERPRCTCEKIPAGSCCLPRLQLSIKIDLKALRQACLLATMLTRQKCALSCLRGPTYELVVHLKDVDTVDCPFWRENRSQASYFYRCSSNLATLKIFVFVHWLSAVQSAISISFLWYFSDADAWWSKNFATQPKNESCCSNIGPKNGLHARLKG